MNSEDLFDHIFMSENRYQGNGYRDGFEEGTRQGMLDGQKHGASHGAKVSTEVSFYRGFALTWKCLLQDTANAKSRKQVKAVESLIGLVEQFGYDNAMSTSLLDEIQKIRTKFRQVCSLLSVPTDFHDYVNGSSGMSF